ncbi:hypothetical protein [Ralstonia mannitolilytica]|uniref:hypothetical protein n=1 Tax=Ralstonia mannitolilytica TaxID=105219 RepID=UPI0012E8041C|nr:hypothetical protein [Ralstonia mannitolilytica]
MSQHSIVGGFDTVARPVISDLLGKPCCRQRVGRMRSLSIGVGEKVPHGSPRMVDDFYGEWEIGTYSAAWRVVRDGRILCGSQDVIDSLAELDSKLNSVDFGLVTDVVQISKFDIRVCFAGATYVDFISAASGDDEIFHVFCPGNSCLEYSAAGGWRLGSSSRP